MSQQTHISTEVLSNLLSSAKDLGLVVCSDVLIFNENNEIFIQKRSSQRKLYPNCWEVPGGHVENGESIAQTLARELVEETSMELTAIVEYVDFFDWEKSDGTKCRNFQFLATATGTPRLEENKSTEFRWIKQGEESVVMENREPSDNHHYHIIKKAFEILNK